MSLPDRVAVTTVVSLDPAAAFRAFTDEVDAWWRRGPRFRFGEAREGTIRFEGGAGGRLLEVFEGGEPYEIGRVTEWRPGELLALTWRARHDPGEHTEVAIRFTEVAGGTRITVEHRGFEAIAERSASGRRRRGRAFLDETGLWWGDLLAALRAHRAP